MTGASGRSSEAGPSWRVTRTVPSESRCLDGHFPGNPLAPGAYLLALAAAALDERGLELVSIRRVKFVGPVRPETEIEIQIQIQVTDQAVGRGGPALVRWVAEGALVAEARVVLKVADG